MKNYSYMPAPHFRRWRAESGLTQNEVAGLLGYTRSIVSKWEREVAPIPRVVGIALRSVSKRKAEMWSPT